MSTGGTGEASPSSLSARSLSYCVAWILDAVVRHAHIHLLALKTFSQGRRSTSRYHVLKTIKQLSELGEKCVVPCYRETMMDLFLTFRYSEGR